MSGACIKEALSEGAPFVLADGNACGLPKRLRAFAVCCDVSVVAGKGPEEDSEGFPF